MKKFALALLFVAGCSTHIESDHETGRHTITCEDNISGCYDRATSTCPDGYLVTNRVRPRKTEQTTVFTLKIRCRDSRLFR